MVLKLHNDPSYHFNILKLIPWYLFIDFIVIVNWIFLLFKHFYFFNFYLVTTNAEEGYQYLHVDIYQAIL